MPELVSKGPTIPVQLMNKLDSGGIVLFCGAGVSVGTGSGLPTFADLVQHVYDANGMVPDEVEREALHLHEPDQDRRRPQLDKALGLLEGRDRLGVEALRRTVIERLSQPATGELTIHKALIALSRQRNGVRLVTTNFDNRFVDAELHENSVDAAPKLPVPKRHNWASLVHLHGRIIDDDDGSSLVLTAADFGRAYLTERWAARFVTELFREFTVLFVGYSVADPVMSYMVDALAAERAKGAQFADAYAFASYDGTPGGLAKARDTWRAKNVDPILYDSRDHHRLLTETLIKWAAIRSDPLHARSQIAINDITKLPGGPDDPVVERVVWALENPAAARALASAPPIVDEDEFTKVETWLERFAHAGFLQFPAGEAGPGAIGEDGKFVRLVDSGLQSRNPGTLDATRRHLARWIARHAHVPQVLTWVVRNGGCMHAGLKTEIQVQLCSEEARIPSGLRLLWTVLLSQEPRDPRQFLWTSDHYKAADQESERRQIEDDVVASMEPHLTVLAGPSRKLRFAQYMDQAAGSIPPIDACAHLKLVAGDSDHRHQIKAIVGDAAVLARHAQTLTSYLEKALVLAKDVEDISPDSSVYLPSIAPHRQNLHHESWTMLIEMVRDGYLALAESDRARADNLLRRWVLTGEPLFGRLALHALTENPKSDIQLATKLLVSGRRPGVWSDELRREALRFLRRAGARLPRALRVDLVRVIHVGPKRRLRRPWPKYESMIRDKTALRLHKLAASGARLDKRSRALADEAAEAVRGMQDDRDEFLRWVSKAEWVGPERLAPAKLLEAESADIATAVRDESVDADAFRHLAAARPQKAADALRQLTAEGRWPAPFWQGLLWSIPHAPDQPESVTELREDIAGTLINAPVELFEEIGSAASSFVEEQANTYGTEREEKFARFWARAWSAVDAAEAVSLIGIDDPMTDALNHPAGKLAEAALSRLSKYKPEAGKRLPAQVCPYFNEIADSAYGHLGRMMLAARLHYLHAIDPDWVVEKLVPYMSPGQSEEARNLWHAYSWSRTIGPNLLQALKEPFLKALQDAEINAHTDHNLTIIFMTVCLEAPDELAEEEIRGVVETMAEEALKTVLEYLRNRLQGESAERGQIWRERVEPWLRRYWPRAAGRNTAGTSKAMLEMLAECGDAFPEATDWALARLQPIERGLYRLRTSGHAKSHPNETLRVLEKVIAPGVLADHNRHLVREILEEIGAAQPNLQANPGFGTLYQMADQ